MSHSPSFGKLTATAIAFATTSALAEPETPPTPPANAQPASPSAASPAPTPSASASAPAPATPAPAPAFSPPAPASASPALVFPPPTPIPPSPAPVSQSLSSAPAPVLPEGEPGPRSRHGAELALELGGAFQAGAHFPENSDLRNVEEAIDADLGLGLWLIPRSSWAIGLSVERIGLGKDHYATDANGQTLNASYDVDTLWLSGRLFFSEDRPAFFLGLAAGPALPRVRATGTRSSSNEFAVPPQPFECSGTASIGAALAASAGVEFDIADAFSFVGEGRMTGHFLSASPTAFDGCAPGSGPAIGGSLRVGFAWRFGL